MVDLLISPGKYIIIEVNALFTLEHCKLSSALSYFYNFKNNVLFCIYKVFMNRLYVSSYRTGTCTNKGSSRRYGHHLK